MKYLIVATLIFTLAGCARIDFNSTESTGLVYYDTKPYMLVTVTDKCVSTVSAVSLPGQQKVMYLKNGFGSSELTASFSGGMVTAVGQISDTKIPETLTSIAALGALDVGPDDACKPSTKLYPIENGEPNMEKPINLLIGQ